MSFVIKVGYGEPFPMYLSDALARRTGAAMAFSVNPADANKYYTRADAEKALEPLLVNYPQAQVAPHGQDAKV